MTYEPYGFAHITGPGPAPDFGFAGMYFHQRSGLSLTIARAYSPTSGRWLSRDPLAEGIGANLYAYVANNPIGFKDPEGMDPMGAQLGAIIGAQVGGGVGGAIGGIGGLAVGAESGPGVIVTTGAGASWGSGVGATLLGAAGAAAGSHIPVEQIITETITGVGNGIESLRALIGNSCMAKKKPRESKSPIIRITPNGTPIRQHADERGDERYVDDALIDKAIDKGEVGKNPNFEGGKIYSIETHTGVKIYVHTDGVGAVVTVTEGR